MTTLIVGFDSAWTPGKRGAITAVLRNSDGSLRELGTPSLSDFSQAQVAILEWQSQTDPQSTIVLIDQPTIVPNGSGQRPVENIVSASVSRRRGGMQPANTARTEMFGCGAPIWQFLEQFGGAADPQSMDNGRTFVLETYPVLALIALGWLREDSRPSGRLPKYNPDRRKTFSLADWQYVCQSTASFFVGLNLLTTAAWVEEMGSKAKPSKSDQDLLDACLCLLVGIHVAEERSCLLVGDTQSGYIVAPYCPRLESELSARCVNTGKSPAAWVQMLGSAQ